MLIKHLQKLYRVCQNLRNQPVSNPKKKKEKEKTKVIVSE